MSNETWKLPSTVQNFPMFNCNSGWNTRCDEVLGKSIASVVWVAVYYVGGSSLGGWIGATMAGVLYDSFGFRTASIFLWTLYAIMVIAVVKKHILYNRYYKINILTNRIELLIQCLLVLTFILVSKSSQVDTVEAEIVSRGNVVTFEAENNEREPLVPEKPSQRYSHWGQTSISLVINETELFCPILHLYSANFFDVNVQGDTKLNLGSFISHFGSDGAKIFEILLCLRLALYSETSYIMTFLELCMSTTL